MASLYAIGGTRLPIITLLLLAVCLLVTLVVEYKEFRNEVKSIAGSGATMDGTAAAATASTDPNLQKLVNDMWSADKVNRAAQGDVTLNWGRHIKWGNNGSGMAPAQPLFSFVNETLFEENPLYKALIGIYNTTGLFHPPVCTTEPSTTGDRLDTFNSFLYQVTNTTVFKKAYQYLYSKGKGGDSWDAFYPQLFDMWFGTYSRCSTTIGSSGWEHVFSGELRESIVDGHHNWVRYYLEQKAGNVVYHGYYDYTPRRDHRHHPVQVAWEPEEDRRLLLPHLPRLRLLPLHRLLTDVPRRHGLLVRDQREWTLREQLLRGVQGP